MHVITASCCFPSFLSRERHENDNTHANGARILVINLQHTKTIIWVITKFTCVVIERSSMCNVQGWEMMCARVAVNFAGIIFAHSSLAQSLSNFPLLLLEKHLTAFQLSWFDRARKKNVTFPYDLNEV